MKKPIIGIVTKHYKEDKRFINTFIRDEVKQAIFDNGGISIGILAPNKAKVKAKNDWNNSLTKEEYECLLEEIKMCNGIILQGGGFSDEYECIIAKYCYDYDIPLLGICAGLQNMVRALNGKVIKLEQPETHETFNKYVHNIKIMKSSKLYEIVGKEEIKVNSRHHCHASVINTLDISAYSSDGIVEAVEARSKKFFIGVQFHPESLYKEDENMNKIFDYFIKSCKK